MNRRLLTGVVAAVVVTALAVPSGASGYPRPGAYTQVDLTSSGGQASVGHVEHPSISATGRYVAFDSDAALTPGSDAGSVTVFGRTLRPSNVFVRDRVTGRTTLVSRSSTGLPGRAAYGGSITSAGVPGEGRFPFPVSFDPAISSDGRFIAFTSLAADMVPSDSHVGFSDVFVYDTSKSRMTWVSVDSQGRQSNGNSYLPSISADGRYVSFTSDASNLVSGDTNSYGDVFVRDLKTGKTTRVSVSSGGAQADGCALSLPIPSTLPVSAPCAANIVTGGPYPSSSISGDGRYVEFDDLAANLVSGDTNGTWDVFVHDRKTGRTLRVSVATGGAQAQSVGTDTPSAFGWPVGSTLTGQRGHTPGHGISADGRYTVFVSQAYNLVPNDTNGIRTNSGNSNDVYVHDITADRTYRVDVHADGSECPDGNGTLLAYDPSISADGRYVGFSQYSCTPTPSGSDSSGWSCGSDNSACVLFLYDRLTGQPDRVPEIRNGKNYTAPNGRLYSASGAQSYADVSEDGRYISLAWEMGGPVSPTSSTLTPSDAFVWDRGAAVGVGRLAASGKLAVAGTPSFPSTGVITAAGTTDLGQVLTPEGADLVGASIAYRPAYGDLFARLQVAQMPMFAAASPALVYGLRLTVNGTDYEVRVAKGGPDALVNGGASFGLFRLIDGAWTKVATLHGGYGTTGAEVTVALPLRDLGVQDGGRLSDVRAFTALGTYDAGAAQLLDQVVLAGASR
jgi:Tol biopolymer transport system component